jgi:hypothetical protein
MSSEDNETNGIPGDEEDENEELEEETEDESEENVSEVLVRDLLQQNVGGIQACSDLPQLQDGKAIEYSRENISQRESHAFSA